MTAAHCLAVDTFRLNAGDWPGGLADVDVSLGGEHEGQPDAGVVEHLRRSLPQQLKQEAGGAAPVHILVTEEERIIIQLRDLHLHSSLNVVPK